MCALRTYCFVWSPNSESTYDDIAHVTLTKRRHVIAHGGPGSNRGGGIETGGVDSGLQTTGCGCAGEQVLYPTLDRDM
jgi:hypothetical protein